MGNDHEQKISVTKFHMRFGQNGSNMEMKQYIYKLTCTSCHESCLGLETMGFSLKRETDLKTVQNL